MAIGVLLLVTAVFAVRGADSRLPPKFIKASYGVQKALYAQQYGYSLVPIPNRILIQTHPVKSAGLTARVGRSRKYYRPWSRSRRRRKRPPKRRKRPGYGIPVYAHRYKHYIPQRRRPYNRYKKNRHRYRPHYRKPYRDHHDFDYYEQEIPDDYEEYDQRDADYLDYDGPPLRRLPLEHDKEFLNRHAELYNSGYNTGVPKGRVEDNGSQHTEPVRTRVHYQTPVEEYWHEHSRNQREPTRDEHWDKPPRNQRKPTRNDHWDEPPRPPMKPTRPQEVRGWTSSLRPKPLTAAVGSPSRPVVPRDSNSPPNHRHVYNWDPSSSSYQVVEHWNPPRYQAHYSEESMEDYRDSHDSVERQTTETESPDRINLRKSDVDEDIGFGQGMEVVDDGVAGWKVN